MKEIILNKDVTVDQKNFALGRFKTFADKEIFFKSLSPALSKGEGVEEPSIKIPGHYIDLMTIGNYG